jgi:transcriptional regulator with XRE-family HTH domain
MGMPAARGGGASRFAGWLEASMHSRGLSQAELARCVGVADAQVSRWRRGQVVPTVRYLQRIADTFGVHRSALDRLVGYPIASSQPPPPLGDPAAEAELQAQTARLRQVMQRQLPRHMWPPFVEACLALADALVASARASARQAGAGAAANLEPADHADRPFGFRSLIDQEVP